MQRMLFAGLAVAAVIVGGTAFAGDEKTLADYDGCAGIPVVVTQQAPADSEAPMPEAAARTRIGAMIDGALAKTAPADTPPLLASSPLPRREAKPGT